jgi:hypothetical protein
MKTSPKQILGALLLSFFLLLGSKTGLAQNTLYDNFDSPLINPSNWQGMQYYDPDMREALREIVPTPGVSGDRRLRLSQTGYSSTTDNNGGTGSALGLFFTNPNNVTAVSFTIVVRKEQAVGCAGNPSVPAGVSAGFEGSFFNTSNAQNGAQGDVKANIYIDRSSSSTGTSLDVGGGYYLCNDATCSSKTGLFGRSFGSVKPGSTNILTLQWNQTSHQFTFQLNKNAPVVSTYSVVDSFPPGFAAKYISTERIVPHCTTTPRPTTYVDSYFDNVYVNP